VTESENSATSYIRVSSFATYALYGNKDKKRKMVCGLVCNYLVYMDKKGMVAFLEMRCLK